MSMSYAEIFTSPTEILPMPGFLGAGGEGMMSLGMGMCSF